MTENPYLLYNMNRPEPTIRTKHEPTRTEHEPNMNRAWTDQNRA